jgi:hypothetical protein
MALVTTYATLQTHIADTLNRSDLTDVIPNFIQQFESQAKRDQRLRKLSDRGTFSITGDGQSLPSDFYKLDSWYHDGSSYFGPIQIVPQDEIGRLKGSYGDTGVPQFAAIIPGDGTDSATVRFAPEPDATYNTKMVYERRITDLSDTETTNYLLLEAPDIYLYGALVESAPYLKDDNRMMLWKSLLEERIEAYHMAQQDARWGGPIKRQYTPIGG